MKNTLQVTENAVVSMSSREIAELTGKRHDNVVADIRAMLESLNIHSAEFSAQYKDSTGRSLLCFNLPKRETLILVSGYSVEMRAKIIDRWQELENQVRFPALTDHSQVLVEINSRLAKIEETQVPKRGQQSTEGWNNHHKRDLARVQAEIRSLKSEIKTSPPTPTAEHSERIYLKRLIQQELVLEELIQRNGQYHALWLTHHALADQVRLLSDRARRLEDCADPELADDLTNLFNSFFSPIEMES